MTVIKMFQAIYLHFVKHYEMFPSNSNIIQMVLLQGLRKLCDMFSILFPLEKLEVTHILSEFLHVRLMHVIQMLHVLDLSVLTNCNM